MKTMNFSTSHKTRLPMAHVRLYLLVFTVALGMGAIGCGGGGSNEDSTKSDSTGGTHENDGTAGEEAGEQHSEGEHAEDEHADERDEGGEIVMTAAAMKDAGIEVESVKVAPTTASITAPGRVVPTQHGIAHVGTTIPGRITRLFVSEGARVGRGAALAEIEAVGIGEIKGQYVSARARVEQARQSVARNERLLAENLGARRNVEEARAALEQATADLRAAGSRLRSLGIDPSSVGSGSFTSRILLRSPIAGVVARRTVVLGEYVEPNKDAFEVVNAGTVWIDAQVSPTVATSLRVGGVGFVRDEGDHRHTGRISFIAPTVNPESRTVTVRTEVINPDVHMRPESYVSMEFEGSVSGRAVTVPKSAIEQVGGSAFVYRENEPGHFERVMVDLAQESGDRRVVAAGLKEGDRIAVAGVFYLKSARQKGELQEHDH
jgi:cobalt-zinc-cadmium efflux system membrane fusion protein